MELLLQWGRRSYAHMQPSSDKLAAKGKTVTSVQLPLGLFLFYHSFPQHVRASQAHSLLCAEDRAANKMSSLSPGAYLQLGSQKLNLKSYN